MSEPRKASDVVLELETKIDTLLKIVSLQSQSINLISNKLNTVMATLDKEKSKITVEAINKSPTPTFNGFVPDPERAIPIFAESRIPIESAPQGFRRTSRPETFEQPQVNSYQNKSEEIEFKDHPSAMVPAKAFPNQKAPEKSPLPQVQKKTIPTMQRILDKNGKAVFMAAVEITDTNNNQVIYTGKTNGIGKWQATLPVGQYRVHIKKMPRGDEPKIEAQQMIRVDDTSPTLELPSAIINN